MENNQSVNDVNQNDIVVNQNTTGVNQHPKDFDRNLTQSTIEAIEKLARIEAEERAILNGSESVELNDGKLLNKEEQLAFFEQVYKLAVLNGACNQVQKFKHLYETEDFYGAWSVLYGNINWLSNKNILHKEKHWLPKSVSIKTTYYDNGQVLIKCQYKDDKRDGEYVSYYDNGQVWIKCQYKDGKPDGECVECYRNGQVLEKCQYKDGKRDGEYVRYRDNGQVWTKCQYKDDKLDGDYVRYRDNGKVWTKCQYKDDKLDGEYVRYRDNGQVWEKCQYKDDKLLD